jgi:hypothetical protein
MSDRLPEVWKFRLNIDDRSELQMPVGAKVLHIAEQQGVARLWALVDPDAPLEFRKFRLAGTGHPIQNGFALKHHGSFLMRGDKLVFHLFEDVS